MKPLVDHGEDGMDYSDIEDLITLGLRVRCAWRRHNRTYASTIRGYVPSAVIESWDKSSESSDLRVLTLAPKDDA